ncbi:MAG: ABC transporter permease subunit [Candidatus Izemoplasma sp.]
MNIVKRELRANLKAFIIWSVAISLFMLVEMSGFKAYYNNPDMLAIFDTMDPRLLEAFKFNGIDLTTLIGFLSVLTTYIFLLLGIYAVLLGSSIISKEERSRTAEYLFTLPIKRTQVISSKLISAVINNFLILIVTLVAITIGALPYDVDYEYFEFIGLVAIAIFIVQLIFLSVGMLLASVIKRYKKSGSYAVAILLVTYIFSIIADLNHYLEFLKYFSPFSFFSGRYIVNNGALHLGYLALSIVVIIISIIGTYYFYPKRDLRI